MAALEDEDYFQETCDRVIKTREQMTADLEQLGFDVIPSAANFVFARHPQFDAAEIARFLRERAIIVRHFKLLRCMALSAFSIRFGRSWLDVFW